MSSTSLHIAMYPWFALGHLTPFLHLSNKLAKKGHKISFLIPTKTQPKLQPFNLHPHLITFVPITIPHVQGLPHGAETTSDVPFSLFPLIMTAMDLTENHIEHLLFHLKVDVVFFDFTHWIPALARRLGIKSVHYSIISPTTVAYALSPERRLFEREVTEVEMMKPPTGFPYSSIGLHLHEARNFAARTSVKFGSDIRFCDRLYISLSECNALGYGACWELEGPYCNYLESQFQKPVLLSGPPVPEPPNSALEDKFSKLLGSFKAGSIIYCAFGSECTLEKDQFQELLLGFEITGMPFFAVLKPPHGAESVEAALPEGFEERVSGRGVVYGGWVQQQLILEHPSVGCFVTHCGWASLSEALVNKCRLVLLPNAGDQVIHARIMSRSLKVGVEVEKGEEDGLFTKESVCKAVRTVMEEDSEIGKDVRANHARLREFLLKKDLKSSYIDSFNKKLQDLL